MKVETSISKAMSLKETLPRGCHNPYCDVECVPGECIARPAYTELWVCADCNNQWSGGNKPKWLKELQDRNRPN